MVILVNLKLLMITGNFLKYNNKRSSKIVVELIGRINKCGVISPRYDVGLGDFEKWSNSILPCR